MAKTTDIKKALKTLSNETATYKKSEIESLAEALSGVVVAEMTDERDKESFLQVTVLVKKLTSRLKDNITKIDEKHKPGIEAAKTALEKAKEAYDGAVSAFKDAQRELKRIDGEARNAISLFATKKMREAQTQEVEAPKPGQRVAMPTGADAADMGLSKGGHDLTFATRKVVQVVDLDKVPENLVTRAPDMDAWGAALKKLGLSHFDLSAQASGQITLKVKLDDMPATLTKRSGVKESAIIQIGGCTGVEIVDEARAVVK